MHLHQPVKHAFQHRIAGRKAIARIIQMRHIRKRQRRGRQRRIGHEFVNRRFPPGGQRIEKRNALHRLGQRTGHHLIFRQPLAHRAQGNALRQRAFIAPEHL